MNISEEDIRNDKDAREFINLSHFEMPLPDIDDLSEYYNVKSEIYENVPREKIQEVFDFIERIKQKHESL